MSRYGWGGDTWQDNNGEPLSGGLLYFYETGTTTAKNTFSNDAETVPNTNPVILDAAGRQGDIFFSGQAKVVLRDADGVQIDVIDPVGTSLVDGAFSDWVVTVEYSLGDTVTATNGDYYVSITSGNAGNDPTVSPVHWQRTQFIYTYNANYSYAAGDIAQSGNKLYVSLVGTNVANSPPTSTADWMPLANDIWPELTVQAADFVAQTGRSYQINTAGGAFAMTLPPSPSVGDRVGFYDYGGTFMTFNFTVGRNGSNILGAASDLVCNVSYFGTILTFTSGRGWIFT